MRTGSHPVRTTEGFRKMNTTTMESKRSPLLPIAAALALGGLHQLLFFGKVPGVSVPLFLLLFYAYFWTFGREAMRPPERAGLLLTAAALLLALTYGLFDNPVFFVLNLIALPVLVAWQLTYMLGDRKRSWHDPMLIADAIGHGIKQTLMHIPDLWAAFRRKPEQEDEPEEEGDSPLRQVMYGLLIAAPVLILVSILLLSADGVLRTMAEKIPVWFTRLSLGDGTARLVWSVVIGVFFFTYLAGFRSPRRKPPVQGPAMASFNAAPANKFQTLVTVTLMITLNLVYVLFVAFQFSYLFGAWQGVLPESASYAEYARSGFGELIGVTFINFALLLIGMYATRPGTGKTAGVLNGLLYLLVFCSAAMLGSAFSRLLMYEEAYGYTRLRFLVHAFMIFLFLLMILFALCIRFRRLPLGRWMVALAVCAYLAVNYSFMDRMIALLNLQREEASADMGYLIGLSSDAVPVLVEYGAREGGEVDSLLRQKASEESAEPSAWQSWNLSDWQARGLLERYVE